MEAALSPQDLLRQTAKDQPAVASSADAAPYLRAVAAGRIFKEPIFTYVTLKDSLLGDQAGVLGKVIAEEKRHLIQLSELRDRLG